MTYTPPPIAPSSTPQDGGSTKGEKEDDDSPQKPSSSNGRSLRTCKLCGSSADEDSEDSDDVELKSRHVCFRSHESLHPYSRPISANTSPETAVEAPLPARSWTERTFGPLNEGSQRSFIFALCNTAFGSGILALPWVFGILGLPLATVILIASAGFSLLSLQMLANASVASGQNEYKSVVQRTLGNGMSVFLRVLIFVYVFGSVSSYFLFLEQFISKALAVNFGINLNKAVILLAEAILIIGPSGLTLGQFARFNGAATASVPIVVTMLIINFWLSPVREHTDWWKPANVDFPNFPKAIVICFFAFSCHVNLFAAYTNYNSPVSRRVNKVLIRTVFLQFTVYWITGVIGYLTFGPPCMKPTDTNCTFDNVLKSADPSSMTIRIAYVAMAFLLFVSIPVNIFAAREQIIPTEMQDVFQPGTTRWPVLVYTPLFCIACMSVGLSDVGLSDILTVTGGFGAVSFMFTIPVAVSLKLRKMHLLSRRTEGLIGNFVGISRTGSLVALGVLLIPITVGYFGAILTLIQIIWPDFGVDGTTTTTTTTSLSVILS